MINKIIKEAVNAVFCILMIGLFFAVHIDINVENIVKLSLIGFLCSWFNKLVYPAPKDYGKQSMEGNAMKAQLARSEFTRRYDNDR